MPCLIVLGARRLGGAVADHFAAAGYDLVTVSRSEESARAVRERHPRALALTADAAEPSQLEGVAVVAEQRFGPPDLAINAVSTVRRGVVMRGPLGELSPEAMDAYTGSLIPAVFHFLRIFGGIMARRRRGTLIQITGGSARRAMPRGGPWAAAAHATRALTHSAAQELRPEGVHAALLVVDAIIESDKTAALLEGKPPEASTTHEDVVAAVEYLVNQSPRGWSHELTLTPRGDRWLP
jgi:NAD(P)-dependent dehydrogenase (short-subunit alcohol dehydrogenase family)